MLLFSLSLSLALSIDKMMFNGEQKEIVCEFNECGKGKERTAETKKRKPRKKERTIIGIFFLSLD